MNPRIVCVDDEPRILKGLRRRIGRDYDVTTAESGAEALEIMEREVPFQVVVSDMRMPVMSGAEFLAKVRTQFPDTVRILLTGQSDLNDAIAAVNEGSIFRFLSKPCPPEVLMPALSDAVEHYRLIQAERELLEGTVRGSVTLLTEILSIKDPIAFNRGSRLKHHVRQLAAELEVTESWDLEVAAMLSQIGFAVVPSDIVERARSGLPLSDAEQQLYDSHLTVARDLLANIPRLETVSAMIGASGSSLPQPEARVALGVQLLTAAADYDGHLEKGLAAGAAVCAMRDEGVHSDDLLKALDRMAVASGGYVEKSLGVADLVSGLVLAEDLHSTDGRLLLSEGTELSLAARTRIQQYSDHVGVREPILVRVPL